jgi:hypothetical protein
LEFTLSMRLERMVRTLFLRSYRKISAKSPPERRAASSTAAAVF